MNVPMLKALLAGDALIPHCNPAGGGVMSEAEGTQAADVEDDED
jgi:hypothetical protein